MAVGISLLYLHYSLSLSQFQSFLCHLSPFLLSCVVVSRPFCLLEFYPNKASVVEDLQYI